MDRAKIAELRAEIAVLEPWSRGEKADGVLQGGATTVLAQRCYDRARRHGKLVGGESCKHAYSLALAEARAELAALEQREPTIEERFPVGSRWRLDGGSEVRRVIGHGGPNAVAPHVVKTIGEMDGFVGFNAPAYFEYSERLDDTPPAQPVDPRNICDEGFMFCGDCAPCRDLVASAPTKPAPTCEAPGWIGPQHPVDADSYGCCRTCRAAESDRRRERRRRFDAWPVDVMRIYDSAKREHSYEAVQVTDEACVRGPSRPARELAIAALWEKLERAR
jgi:hypothetical protein